MTDKGQKRKRLVRTLIYVFAAVVAVLVATTLIIGHLPPPPVS